LVAVTTLRTRDRNGPRVAMQVLVYPVADADVNTPSYLAPENQLLLSRDSMIWFWDHYLPDAARRSEPDASPLRATSLAGLPPAFVILAEHDVLRDEGEAYAERLRVEGVPVEMQVYEGQMHAFFTLLMLPENARAVEDACAAIEHYLVAQPA
ncbi:MAG: alpha/beta hydrolase, partial [Chloroflexaceae bacterium]|nr:alpha/beta hydrolase [Chloroflexaceae bacterium]